VPGDLTPSVMGRVSSFLQSQKGGHVDLCPEPLEFNFDAVAAGTAELHISSLSKAGAHVRVFLDGKQVDEYEGPPGESDRPVDVTLKASFTPGKHTVRVGNDGADWVVFDRLKLAPFGPDVKVFALSESDWMLVRATGQRSPLLFHLTKLSLADADYDLTAIDLDSGKIEKSKAKVKGFKVENMALGGKDFVLIFSRE
jgi:hypothetical protein